MSLFFSSCIIELLEEYFNSFSPYLYICQFIVRYRFTGWSTVIFGTQSSMSQLMAQYYTMCLYPSDTSKDPRHKILPVTVASRMGSL